MDLPTDRFVRLPSQWLDALLRTPLSGTEWRILLWVIRNTCGWGRAAVRFSWYQVARDLGADRGGVSRTGKRLLKNGLLQIELNQIGLSENVVHFNQSRKAVDVVCPRPMTTVNGDGNHRKRGRPSSFFRRAIDSSKDLTSIHRNIINVVDVRPDDNSPRLRSGTRPQHPAGAAHPVPTKYDSRSAA